MVTSSNVSVIYERTDLNLEQQTPRGKQKVTAENDQSINFRYIAKSYLKSALPCLWIISQAPPKSDMPVKKDVYFARNKDATFPYDPKQLSNFRAIFFF